jgi:hypothetical protein
MLLHDLKLVFLSVSNNFLNNILDGLDEIFESHLVGIGFFSHDLDEDEVVVIFGDFLIGHTGKIGQFGELGRS